MVMRKGENWSAEELRRYAADNFPPRSIVKTNLPYDKGAAIILPDGKVAMVTLLNGKKIPAIESSNYRLVQLLTNPESEIAKEAAKGVILPILDIPPQYNIKDYAEKKMAEALSHLIEAQTFSGEKNLKIMCDKNGMAVRIKTDVFEYNTHGRIRKRK